VVLAVFNYSRKQSREAILKVDLDGLGLVPELKWQECVRSRDLYKRAGNEPDAKLDFYERTLTVGKLAPHTVRIVGLRRY
jgi:hypothetical protein